MGNPANQDDSSQAAIHLIFDSRVAENRDNPATIEDEDSLAERTRLAPKAVLLPDASPDNGSTLPLALNRIEDETNLLTDQANSAEPTRELKTTPTNLKQ